VVPPVSYPSGVGLTDRQARKEGGIAMAKAGIRTFLLGTLSLTVVSWKRTAKMKKFQSLPDLHPVAVFHTVRVYRSRWISAKEYFRIFDHKEIMVKIDGRWKDVIELRGEHLLIATDREECYKIDDTFLVVSYSLSPKEDYWKWRKDGYRELKKDYLLLVNGYKIRIPKPKACGLGIPSGIEDMFKASEKLERILRGEEELKFAWEWHTKLVFTATGC
jgi:hypothetical protein